jgi:DNA repair exonuclease SbcCD ATPase subunit
MSDYQKILVKKEEIEKQLEVAKQEYQEVSSLENNALHKLPEMNAEVNRFKQGIQQENIASRQSVDFLTPDQKSKLKALEQAANDTYNSAKELGERKKKLNQKISDLQAELSSFSPTLSVLEVLRYQKTLAAAEQKVDNLVEAIQKQEEVIEQTQRSLGPVPSYAQKREDLLAEIAVGKATESDLKKLDKEIEANLQKYEKEQDSASQITGTAQETIEGLNRKLATAKAELSVIKTKKSDVLNQFLKSEAERVGEEYATLTAKLVERFEQLVALDNMLGQSAKLRVNGYDRFLIPIFNVKACQEQGHHNHPGQFWSVRNAFDFKRSALVEQAEQDRLENLGVQI